MYRLLETAAAFELTQQLLLECTRSFRSQNHIFGTVANEKKNGLLFKAPRNHFFVSKNSTKISLKFHFPSLVAILGKHWRALEVELAASF